jgi:hypothetical protein
MKVAAGVEADAVDLVAQDAAGEELGCAKLFVRQ